MSSKEAVSILQKTESKIIYETVGIQNGPKNKKTKHSDLLKN